MNDFRRRWFRVALIAGVTIGAGACVETTTSSYRAVPSTRVDSAYVDPAADFSRYRRLMAAPLEIYYYAGQPPPDPATLERIRRIFDDAFRNAIGDDYPIVTMPGPDVLAVRGSLVDLELSPVPTDLPVAGRAAALVSGGHLTFFMELADSESGRVLARAADRESDDGRVSADEPDAHWVRTQAAAEHWAGLFRDFLDDNLGR